ncbi:hypothetical protein N7492_007528 [Penicillium capsulatum]|uniref:Uncharacterized protein n=1 Tax=Penicillium capsulatum TaxID=69766 RepID=A0A9W9LM56_9EURO|nr:hypothetical protein N7492_007528 [Penicillium capsulatum]KAJ6117362.1 hypothetical protein N7512_007087 [Penicillium capsulatum]
MHPSLPILALCSLSLSAWTAAYTSTEAPLRNANHIFNVIHDSMRQWGSSLHHNGVSFLLASVPAGTLFYHGTSESSPVNGTEWLAFEPEHAIVFAGPRWGGPPPPPSPPGDEDDSGNHHRDELRRREDGFAEDGPPPLENMDQDEQGAGYLHTYAATRNLRLLYLDGMSAGKTNKGTLDSQDVLLFNRSLNAAPRKERGPGPPGERERAMKACEMAENEWAGRIDGVLRMEAGFEIILCRFERDLTPLRITQVKAQSKDGKPGPRQGMKMGPGDGPGDGGKKRKGPPRGGPDSSRWMRAIAARYDGIGGDRVSLNYDNFVTAFSHDVNLFPENTTLPRLEHLSSAALDAIRTQLTSLILTRDPEEDSWNWQRTTDMIVTRYSDELSYLASGKFTVLENLRDHIELLMSSFIDYRERDPRLEAERCATQFLPLQVQDVKTVPARAVHSVARSVCSTLLQAWEEETLDAAVQRVRSLIGYLDWTTWKACRGCAEDEICVVPIWPMGTVADYENPSCKLASNPFDSDGESYWGGMHG